MRKTRGRERGNATRFTTTLEGFDSSTPLDDLEHYRGRLQETLDRLLFLETLTCNESLKKTHQRTAKAANDFWRRWEKEYLLQLKSFHTLSPLKGKVVKVRVGDVVLLHEDCRPRHMRKKAKVEEMKVGRDGVSRTVILRGANGSLFVRPIQLVIPLEVDQGGEDVVNP